MFLLETTPVLRNPISSQSKLANRTLTEAETKFCPFLRRVVSSEESTEPHAQQRREVNIKIGRRG
jgi:hypothetical protein